MSERNPSLLILAAGMGSRYGGLKQADGFGPNGETILDYSVYDAMQAGFKKVIFVIRKSIEEEFRAKVSGKLEDKLEVHYVFQEPNVEIEGLDKIPEREKPWGTGHAVLVAEYIVNEPFCVINADDFYGSDAFKKAYYFLTQKVTESEYGMIGYILKNTLSSHGTVSRGVCERDSFNYLKKVTECKKIRQEGDHVINDDPALPLKFELDDLVSMNMWGFHENAIGKLRSGFIEFVKETQGDPSQEYYLTLLVDKFINQEGGKCKVLPTDSKWFGVTYQEDKPIVEDGIRKLIEAGDYPSKLWD